MLPAVLPAFPASLSHPPLFFSSFSLLLLLPDNIPFSSLGLAKISRAELQKHYTPDDAWLAIDDIVYDMTPFLKTHPGGSTQLMSAAGEDASAVFHSLHPQWVRGTLSKQKIVGQLIAIQDDPVAMDSLRVAPPFDYHDDFSKALRDRVEGEMKRRGDQPRNTWRMWAETAFIVVTYFIMSSFVPFVKAMGWYEEPPLWTYFAAIFIGGPFGALMGMNVMHSSNHGGMADKDSPLMQWFMEHSLDLVGGGSGRWKRSHNFAHHSYTNTSQDPDLQFEPFFRMYEDNTKYSHYQGQTWYWPILAMLNHITWEIRDTLYLIGDYKRWPMKDLFGHLFFTSLHKVYVYVIPYCVVGMPAVYCSILVKMSASSLVVPIFLASHNSLELEHITRKDVVDQVEADPLKKQSWTKWQILSSQNFNAKSHIVNFLTGGLNHQVEHHLFPSIHHSHLPWIAQIVEDTCKEFEVPYTNKSNFFTAFATTISAMDHYAKDCAPGADKSK